MSDIAIHADPISVRIWRLFFAEHQDTVKIARALNVHEAAVDRLLHQMLDARYRLLRMNDRVPATLMTAPAERRTTFNPGERVRYSAKALVKLKPRHPDREGVIAGSGRYPNGDCTLVRWDGLKCAQNFHVSFIERVAP